MSPVSILANRRKKSNWPSDSETITPKSRLGVSVRRLTVPPAAEAVGLSTSVVPRLTLTCSISSGSICWFEKIA